MSEWFLGYDQTAGVGGGLWRVEAVVPAASEYVKWENAKAGALSSY